MRYVVLVAISAELVAACAPSESDQDGTIESAITTAVKHERFGLIRDSAAEMGLYNAALLAGVATSETNLAHCHSEATYACQGPASSSCGGGPIIAGAADGPCSAMQGGLGMFQFDAGTYQDTLNTYGDSILTIEGNTAQAVNFVEVRAIQDKHSTDWLSSMDWMNHVEMKAGAPTLEEWADFIVCRYNGCCTLTSSTCITRRAGYRDNALKAYNEMGGTFWDTSGRCAALPADGVIDQRSVCYLAGGDPRYWRKEQTGYGDNSEWTGTTAAATAANFGMWIVKVPKPGRYPVDVFLDGGHTGTSRAAKYVIVHAGMTDTITVDQTSTSGWANIGDFDFAGTGDEHIFLGDNTGEPGANNIQLMFDAVRVPVDDPTQPPMDGGGCCGTGRGTGPTSLIGIALFAFSMRARRRRRRA